MRAHAIRSLALGFGVFGLLAGPVQAARCAKGSEAAALRTRMMQTELMVAALSCNQKSQYNEFVLRYRPALKRNGSALQSYFRHAYGRASTTELNRFTTRLANEVSKTSLGDIGAFCGNAEKTFARLKEMPVSDFRTFVAARPTADDHGVAVCTVEASADTVKKTKTAKATAKSTPAAKVQPASLKSKAPVTPKAKEKSASTIKPIPAVLAENTE